MEAIVKGVKIILTPDQIKQIEAHQDKQKSECSNFTKTLKHFGFKKMSTKGWVNPNSNCWQTDKWFVDIMDKGNHNERCLVTGVGIPHDSSGWPLIIHSPEELVEILNKALEEIENE